MRRIIEGKSYDTETAHLVGSVEEGMPGDLSYCEEGLYRKRNGEYFLHGSGGAATVYAKPTYSGFAPGEAVFPLAYPDAKKWAKERLAAEAFEAEFGEIDDSSGGKKPITVWIDGSLREALKRRAAETGATQSAIVEEAVRNAILQG